MAAALSVPGGEFRRPGRGCKRRALLPAVAGAWLSEAPGNANRASRRFGHRPRTTRWNPASDSVAGRLSRCRMASPTGMPLGWGEVLSNGQMEPEHPGSCGMCADTTQQALREYRRHQPRVKKAEIFVVPVHGHYPGTWLVTVPWLVQRLFLPVPVCRLLCKSERPRPADPSVDSCRPVMAETSSPGTDGSEGQHVLQEKIAGRAPDVDSPPWMVLALVVIRGVAAGLVPGRRAVFVARRPSRFHRDQEGVVRRRNLACAGHLGMPGKKNGEADFRFPVGPCEPEWWPARKPCA